MGGPFFEPLKPDYYGRGPHKDGPKGPEVNGPFAYAGSERDANGNARGWSAGAGLLSGRIGPNGEARGDVLQAQGHFGGWRGEDGKTNVGFEGDAALARVGMPNGGALGPFGWDVGVMTANANGKINDSTASLGAQANIIEGSATLGNDEHSLRLGGSFGVGLAGRAHYGDADGDGVREYGFGFDAGPFSMDVKSELIGHAVNGIGSAANWVGEKASGAWDAITSW